jgi:hypothetical protein
MKSWKRQRGDSFSSVVKRVVPRAGTLESMTRFVVERSSTSDSRDGILEDTIENRQPAKHEPWT